MWTPQTTEILVFPGNINAVFIALPQFITSVLVNSYHLVIYDMSWENAEIHWNLLYIFFPDVNGHPRVDYSEILCPTRETVLRKKDLMAAMTLPLWLPNSCGCHSLFLIYSSCPISLWDSPNSPIWLTWNS